MKNFLVIGLGRFGMSIAQTLYEAGERVLAIDSKEEIVQEAVNNDILDNVVVADATEEKNLRTIGVNNFDVAFVCIGNNLQSSILVTLLLKELGVKKVIAKAITPAHGKVLEKIGADEIVYPESFMGKRVAQAEMMPNIIEHFKFSDSFIIMEFQAPESFLNRSLIDIKIRKKYRANIIAIKKSSGYEEISPSAESIIEKGDALIVVTDIKTARELEKLR